jgi:hypothetical protein
MLIAIVKQKFLNLYKVFFSGLRRTAEIRVLVESPYHPLYGSESSYLTDIYLTHLAVYGHVYTFGVEPGSVFPTSESIILGLVDRYRAWKTLR